MKIDNSDTEMNEYEKKIYKTGISASEETFRQRPDKQILNDKQMLDNIFRLVNRKLDKIQKLAGEPGQNPNLELRLAKYALFTTENYNGGTKSNKLRFEDSKDYRKAFMLLEIVEDLLEKESVNKDDIFDSAHKEIDNATHYWIGRSEMSYIINQLVSKYHLLSKGFKFFYEDFEELKPSYDLKNKILTAFG